MRWTFCLLSILAVPLIASPVSAQVKIYTQPKIPNLETLGRMNLSLRWMGKIPTEGARDGIFSIQILPVDKSVELLVQTRSGMVQLMDGETGDVKWRVNMDMPYVPMQKAAFNSHSIYIIRKDQLFVLERSTGLQRVFSLERGTGFVKLGYELYLPPTSTPVADEAALFVPSGERLTAYVMPLIQFVDADDVTGKVTITYPEKIPSTPAFLINPPRTLKPSQQPLVLWNIRLLDQTISQKPLITTNQVGVVSDRGIFSSVAKSKGKEDYHYGFYGPVTEAMGQYGDIAYVGAQDYIVYALNMENRALLWRFPAGSRITRPVLVMDDDIFVTTKLKGLFRLNRKEGELLWQNPEAETLLAKSLQFVYAIDNRGFFLVLDVLRGRTMSKLDLRDFQVPVSNTFTDRIYLANHDGTIFCMHHRELVNPVFSRSAPVVIQPNPQDMGQGEMKPMPNP
jgi:outer membrane protein assembly factor BamB